MQPRSESQNANSERRSDHDDTGGPTPRASQSVRSGSGGDDGTVNPGNEDVHAATSSVVYEGLVTLVTVDPDTPVVPPDTVDEQSASRREGQVLHSSLPAGAVEGSGAHPRVDLGAQAEQPASEASSEPVIINLDLHVDVASVKSILGHYFGLFLLLLIPAVLLLIAIILPFWLQELVVVMRFNTTFPYHYNSSGSMLRSYEQYAPCTVFRSSFCSTVMQPALTPTTHLWALYAAAQLHPLLRKMTTRVGIYLPLSCQYNAHSPIMGTEASILVHSYNTEASQSAQFTFAAGCTTDEELSPMVHITKTLISVDAFASALPIGNATIGEDEVVGDDLVRASVVTDSAYNMTLSTCTDFLAACSVYGYRYVWIPLSTSQADGGYVHLCAQADDRQITASPFQGPRSLSYTTVKQKAQRLASGDYTTVLVCTETVYEVNAALRPDLKALTVEATGHLRFYGQLGGIRLVRLEVLSTMGLIVPVIIFIVTEVLLAFSALMIILVGYTIPVQRFQLRQLRTAVIIDANMLADVITHRFNSALNASAAADASSPALQEAAPNNRSGPTADNGRLTAEGQSLVPEEMTSWPYGRGTYITPITDGGLGSADALVTRPDRVGEADERPREPARGSQEEDAVFSPAEASTSPAAVDRTPSSHTARVAHPSPIAVPPAGLTVTLPPLSRSPTLSSPVGGTSMSPADPPTSGTGGSRRQGQTQLLTPVTPGSGSQRRRAPRGDAPTRQSSGQSGSPAATSGTSPLVAISNATLAQETGDPLSATDAVGTLPTTAYEAIANAARETMLHDHALQAKVIRAILLVQQSSIVLALVFAVIGLAFVLAGVGNPAGKPCAFHEYPYCSYTRGPRAQYITLTTLALFFLLILIGFQNWIIRKRVW